MEINKQLGFTLTELLVGLLLSSIIMNALFQFHLSNKRQYLKAQQMLSTQFDVQWISDLLSNSIRRAGFTPCMGVSHLNTLDRRHFEKKVFDLKIEQQPKTRIIVNRMSESFSHLISMVSPTQLIISNEMPLKEQHPIIIADCEHAEIHEVLSINKIGSKVLITLTKPLAYSYSSSTYVGEWFEEQWFIDTNKKRKNTLFYKLFQTEELSSEIHSMKVRKVNANQQNALEIILGLENEATHRLYVVVRGS